MKTRIKLLVCLFFISILKIFSQDLNNHWQLGSLDLDFSTNPLAVNTVSGVSDASQYDNNAYASISDSNGDLLFYFDGQRIYNKNHQSMGEVNYPSPYNYQGAIILPDPGNQNKYYLFYTNYFVVLSGNNPTYSEYFYSIVDFTNNPLGEILFNGQLSYNGDTIINNNVDFRPLTFAKNSSNDGYWVIAQESNKLLSYKLDSAGFDPGAPIVTTLGYNTIYNSVSINNVYCVSKYRIVPDYNNLNNIKLYGKEDCTNYFYSLDFNNSTGEFTNYQSYSVPEVGKVLDFEFSNDYKLIYFIRNSNYNYSNSNYGQIYVKDLSSLSTPARLLYEYNSPTTASIRFSCIQKDKYNNLLVSSSHSNDAKREYLHKIMNPNSFQNSSVQLNYKYLNGKVIYTFPQLILPVSIGCTPFITLNTSETNNIIHSASQTITTMGNYSVSSGYNIVLHAGEAIYIEPNTVIQEGSVFIAEIFDCSIQHRVLKHNVISEEKIETNHSYLYPNPAGDFVTVSMTGKVIREIIVTSLEGFTVFQREVNESDYRINTQGFKKGIYIVTIRTADGSIVTEKLMKN